MKYDGTDNKDLDDKMHQEAKLQIGVTVISAILVILIGMMFYHTYEGLSLLDSWYFIVITLTTVGYGDITPHTSIGKFITPIFILTGIGIMTSLITGMNKYIMKRRVERAGKRAKKVRKQPQT